MKRLLPIEVYSDVVCPWCYIGKRRLSSASTILEDGTDGEDPITIDVTPRAFQLDPTAPVDVATPVIDAYAKKFGGVARATQIIEQVTEVAAADGLEFRLDRAVRANTLRAHRLIWWANRAGSTLDVSDVEDRIMAAYFTDGRNIGSIDTLADIAAEAGADRTEVIAMLDGTTGIDEVADDLKRAADLTITGVPTLVLGGTWGITGAQDADTLVRLLRNYAAANPPDSVAGTPSPGS